MPNPEHPESPSVGESGSAAGPGSKSSPGKPGTRRLGRGLSALLGAAAKPVRVDVPRGTAVTADASAIDDAAVAQGSAESTNSAMVPPPTITPAASAQSDAAEGGPRDSLLMLRPSEVARNPRQPREQFNDAAMRTLTDSIRENGLMQPIVVRLIPTGYELVAGERRLRAATMLGLGTIPAVVRTLDDRQSAEWALIENLQREDLNPLERAKGIDRLIREFSLSHQQAAERVGLERASVSNLLRLLDLDPATATLVARGDLGQGHAKVLLAVTDSGLRKTLAQTVIDRHWSVRRLEAEVRRLLAPADLPPASMMPRGKERSRTQLDDLERRLSEHLGTRVQILVGRRKGQGRLVIDFHGLEHFDGLMERIGYQAD